MSNNKLGYLSDYAELLKDKMVPYKPNDEDMAIQKWDGNQQTLKEFGDDGLDRKKRATRIVYSVEQILVTLKKLLNVSKDIAFVPTNIKNLPNDYINVLLEIPNIKITRKELEDGSYLRKVSIKPELIKNKKALIEVDLLVTFLRFAIDKPMSLNGKKYLDLLYKKTRDQLIDEHNKSKDMVCANRIEQNLNFLESKVIVEGCKMPENNNSNNNDNNPDKDGNSNNGNFWQLRSNGGNSVRGRLRF